MDERTIVVSAGLDPALQAKMLAALGDMECKVVLGVDSYPTPKLPELKLSNVFENYLPEPGAKRIRRRKGGSPAERLLEEQRQLRAKKR